MFLEDYTLINNEREKGKLPAWQDPHKYLNYVIAGCILTSAAVALMLYKLIAWII